MGKKLDVSDYYLGIITATSEYFNNPKRHRYLGTVDFDPFLEKAPMEAILFGIPTLLKKIEKNGEIYYTDEEYSRYKNELVYELHETNALGIILAHIKPFTECYHEEPVWYTEEEVYNEASKNDFFFLEHSYYICSNKTGEESIIILNEFPREVVWDEYLMQLLGEEQFADIASGYEMMATELYNNDVDDIISLPEYIQYAWMVRQFLGFSPSDEKEKSLKKK